MGTTECNKISEISQHDPTKIVASNLFLLKFFNEKTEEVDIPQQNVLSVKTFLSKSNEKNLEIQLRNMYLTKELLDTIAYIKIFLLDPSFDVIGDYSFACNNYHLEFRLDYMNADLLTYKLLINA